MHVRDQTLLEAGAKSVNQEYSNNTNHGKTISERAGSKTR